MPRSYFDDPLLEGGPSYFDDPLLGDGYFKPRRRSAVYRLFNETGELLYVGMTINPHVRFGVHRAKTRWWPEVDHSRTTFEWFSKESRARAAEIRAIRDENPLKNDWRPKGGRHYPVLRPRQSSL